MDKTKPSVSEFYRRDKRIGMCVIVRLAKTCEQEGDRIQRKWGKPSTQSMRKDLRCCSKTEDTSEIEISANITVCECGEEPSEKRGPISNNTLETIHAGRLVQL